MKRVAKLKPQRWNVLRTVSKSTSSKWRTRFRRLVVLNSHWSEKYHVGISSECIYLTRLPTSVSIGSYWNTCQTLGFANNILYDEYLISSIRSQVIFNTRKNWGLVSEVNYNSHNKKVLQRSIVFNSYTKVSKCADVFWNAYQNPVLISAYWNVFQLCSKGVDSCWSSEIVATGIRNAIWNTNKLGLKVDTSWKADQSVAITAKVVSKVRLTVKGVRAINWNVCRSLWVRRIEKHKVLAGFTFVSPSRAVKIPKQLNGGYLPNSTIKQLTDKKKKILRIGK